MTDTAAVSARPAAKQRPAAPKNPLVRKLPWNDKTGRFAPLKAITVALAPLPALYLLLAAIFVGLGPRPTIEALHFIGRWTIWFLLLALAITPARRLFDWSKLIQIRRIVGLTALYYILIHLCLYILDSAFNLWFVASEIVLRIYLTIGFVAILGLVALGVTSTDAMIKRMGTAGWNRLHNTIYVIGVLGFLHYYMQAKADVTEPVLYSGFFFWLMGYRIMAKFLGYKEGLVPLALLSVAAAVTTALAEGAWYQGMRAGVGPQVLAANLRFPQYYETVWDFMLQVRPAWWVLAAGLAVGIASEIRKRFGATRARAPARA
jgi:sulfoxide reductase heme-binding subunit YedZ